MEGQAGTLRNAFRRTPLGRKAMAGGLRLAEATRLFPEGLHRRDPTDGPDGRSVCRGRQVGNLYPALLFPCPQTKLSPNPEVRARPTIQRVLGLLLAMFSTTMLLPIVVSLIFADGQWLTFSASFLIILWLRDLAVWWPVREQTQELRLREGFLVVAAFWIVLGLFGSVPLLLTEPSADEPHRRGLRVHVRTDHHRGDGIDRACRTAGVDSVLPPSTAVVRGPGHHRARRGGAAHAGCGRHAACTGRRRPDRSRIPG